MHFGKELSKRKMSLLHYLWMYIFLTSCGIMTSQPTIVPAVNTSTLISITTELPPPTLPIIPTASVSAPLLQTPTRSLNETAQPTLIQKSEPFSLDNIRMVYEKDGNIYSRDGLDQPKQLTYSEEDRDPILSSDGEKVVFYRGKSDNHVYSINADGSNEQLIIKSQLLPILAQGDIKALTFVPNTHFVLFNTYLCNESKALYNAPDCSVGVYSVNADSGEISTVVEGLSGNKTNSRNFQISPEGKFISVAAAGYLDLYYFSSGYSDITYPNAIQYYRTTPDEYLPDQYWLPDSSGLVAVTTLSKTHEPGTAPSPYAVLRYTIKDGQVIQIPFELPIVFNSGCNYSVSPDRNWIFYLSDENSQEIKMPTLYLGNLNNGHSQSIEWEFNIDCPGPSIPRWSPDSKYYAFEKNLFAVDGTLIPIDGHFSGWIDSKHYLYLTKEGQSPWKTHIGEIGGSSIELPEDFTWSPEFVILNLPK